MYTVKITALEGNVKHTKELLDTNTEDFRPMDERFETVDQNFSCSESKKKDPKKEFDTLMENSSSNQPTINSIDLPECL